jgi:hypothetical protein
MHVLGVVFGPLCSPVYIETLISGFWLEGGPGQGQSLPSAVLFIVCCVAPAFPFRFHITCSTGRSRPLSAGCHRNELEDKEPKTIHSWVVLPCPPMYLLGLGTSNNPLCELGRPTISRVFFFTPAGGAISITHVTEIH